MTILGLDPFGLNDFQSYSSPVQNMKNVELKNAIYDEIHIREKTDGIDKTNIKEEWQLDTMLLARFLGDLEAGNINNQGVQITQFAIKRRKLTETGYTTLGYKNFVNNNQFIYEDYTQSNDEYIYSIVPVGENGLEGQENSIQIKSDFTGWAVVDRDSNETLMFDKFIGSANSVDTQLNEGRVQLDTLSPYPSFFYTPQKYHTFSLQGVFIPEDWRRSGQQYEQILEQFVFSRKPMLVKGGSGEVYICNVHSPSKSAPNNVWKDHDYMNLTLSFTEVMSYEEYINING
ncbi:hypothetical protein [Bacillus sp. AG4(2022)]|uniref:hypothetical protein n=1 Tax=Bacillus sp. AG4(2022) TaxID=2962594 RepID=UPI002881E1A5|nr:hypothetical protein [Bacillus sp. AG4(2022)]MDT0160261.1 hypothetical protein [Bacillus sp. AG4(2022)]